MTDHYYSQQPDSPSQERVITAQVKGRDYRFYTDQGVFSKDRLDYGSRLLIETFIDQAEGPFDRLLELGSGYGPIALVLGDFYPDAQILGLEINERAYQLALKNQQAMSCSQVDFRLSDARDFQGPDRYHHALTNPPIRAGKATIQAMVARGYALLEDQGSIWVVIQKKQGAASMKSYLEDLGAQVSRLALSKGYWVLVGRKDSKPLVS